MRNYLRNLTIALDRFLNVVFFRGKADETISYNAATAQKNGKKWGCIFCKFLHWAVDHGHCERTLGDEQTSDDAGLRALILLLFSLAMVSAYIYALAYLAYVFVTSF